MPELEVIVSKMSVHDWNLKNTKATITVDGPIVQVLALYLKLPPRLKLIYGDDDDVAE